MLYERWILLPLADPVKKKNAYNGLYGTYVYAHGAFKSTHALLPTIDILNKLLF